ncbi:REF/SRPP-like protein At1g67360 [Henckelia pumila]|uniref:REF/SRPP-like protein At1g67360 n=1 Tax=Henckelia pumila TaxID=405737 RepID=UPI003C6E66D1
MASSQVDVGVERSDAELKHLEFLKILAVHSFVVAENLYDNAKQNSGPLKSTVETVENAVTAVVDPVYQKIKGVPGDLLVFLDKKVDEAARKFDERAPPAAKKAVSKAQLGAKKASLIAQDLAEEVKVAGPYAAISHAGVISKQIAVNQLALFWFKANQYPAVHGASEVAVPAAVHWSEKYNKMVKDMATQGYGLFNYVPLVPVEEMAKAYKQVEAEAAAGNKTDAGSSSGIESDKE